jgi:hypothetical protein
VYKLNFFNGDIYGYTCNLPTRCLFIQLSAYASFDVIFMCRCDKANFRIIHNLCIYRHYTVRQDYTINVIISKNMNIIQRRWCLFFLVKCSGGIQIPYNINCPEQYYPDTHMGKIKQNPKIIWKYKNKCNRKP